MPVMAARHSRADQMLTDAFVLQGGLDEITPTLQLKPGACRQATNFEVAVTGGYTRIPGYERFDGRARPSDATYAILQLDQFRTRPTVGQAVTGSLSGATGQIVAIGANYVVVTLITGSFAPADGLLLPGSSPWGSGSWGITGWGGGTLIGTIVTSTVQITPQQNAQYLAAAADAYRALIGTVPGSGPIRGVASANFNGVHSVFAFRDNLAASATLLYKATPSGWTAVPFFNEVAFTGGTTAQPNEGDTITQGGNTATVKRIVWESGAWGGTAAGRLIITAPSPGNFISGAATVGTGGTTVTLSGPSTAISFLPGGKFEFDYANFAGQLKTTRLYGADGINRCFEFDGTIVAPISTKAATDTPKHIIVHAKALVVTIGSSLMISGPGTPYKFNTTDGGASTLR